MTTQATERYTLDDIGCYVDGAHGIHAIDTIVCIAEDHGMPIPEPWCACGDHPNEYAGCEYVDELEDECDEYMNDHHGVDGAHWGRSEQGDWGLWPSESN